MHLPSDFSCQEFSIPNVSHLLNTLWLLTKSTQVCFIRRAVHVILLCWATSTKSKDFFYLFFYLIFFFGVTIFVCRVTFCGNNVHMQLYESNDVIVVFILLLGMERKPQQSLLPRIFCNKRWRLRGKATRINATMQ